jgi:transposase-like protein
MSSKRYSPLLKEQVVKLRQQGKSYTQIISALGLKSKGTVSYWLKDVILTKKAEQLLKKNSELAYRRGLYKANKNRQEKTNIENIESFSFGRNKIKPIDSYNLAILGATLYWGEGTKAEPKNTSYRMTAFTNSDPKMVSVFMKFLREILLVPENKICSGIHIYSSIDQNKAKIFWSNITKISKDKFYIVEQVSKASKGKRPINSLPFGTVVIKVYGRKYFYIIKGMIDGIIKMTGK